MTQDEEILKTIEDAKKLLIELNPEVVSLMYDFEAINQFDNKPYSSEAILRFNTTSEELNKDMAQIKLDSIHVSLNEKKLWDMNQEELEAAKYGPEGLDYESYFFIVVEDREIDCGDSDMISILKVGRAAKKYNFNLDSSTQKIYNIVEADKKCSSCSRKACEEYGDIGSCDYRSIIDEEI